MTHFVLCHGFGFTPLFWKRLIRYLGPERCTLLDLGYYTQNAAPLSLPKAQPYIGIGHSLGLHKLYALNLPYTCCIGLNGFVDFLGTRPEIQTRRKKELKALRYSLCQDVVASMTQFLFRCGAPGLLPYMDLKTAHLARLLEDLDTFITPFELPTHYPTYMIYSQNDPVIPPTVHNTSAAVEAIYVPKGRHSLGWSYSQQMFHLIQRIHRD